MVSELRGLFFPGHAVRCVTPSDIWISAWTSHAGGQVRRWDHDGDLRPNDDAGAHAGREAVCGVRQSRDTHLESGETPTFVRCCGNETLWLSTPDTLSLPEVLFLITCCPIPVFPTL